MTKQIVVKVHLTVSNHEQADRLRQAIVNMLTGLGYLPASRMERYWKIPEHFEATVSVSSEKNTRSDFTAVLAVLGQGWELHDTSGDEAWAIWNPRVGASFFTPEVGWAHVELLP